MTVGYSTNLEDRNGTLESGGVRASRFLEFPIVIVYLINVFPILMQCTVLKLEHTSSVECIGIRKKVKSWCQQTSKTNSN